MHAGATAMNICTYVLYTVQHRMHLGSMEALASPEGCPDGGGRGVERVKVKVDALALCAGGGLWARRGGEVGQYLPQ